MTRLLIDRGNSVWQLSWVSQQLGYAKDMNSLNAHGTVRLAEFSCDTASTRLELSVGVDALLLSAYTRLRTWDNAYLVGSRLALNIASCLTGRAELLSKERLVLRSFMVNRGITDSSGLCPVTVGPL